MAVTPQGRHEHRTQARRLALQALCVYEALGDAFASQLNEFLRDEVVLDDLGIECPPQAELLTFARELANGAWAHKPAYDELLNRTVTHWRVNRMPPVDRNVLRIGLFELLGQRATPPAIVINEAVELARQFGDKDSPSFVNGVLDAIRRGAAPAQPAAPADTQPPDAPEDQSDRAECLALDLRDRPST